MRRNRPSEAPGLRAKLARGSAGFGAGPNKRDFSGFGGGRNLKKSQVSIHLHRLPFSASPKMLIILDTFHKVMKRFVNDMFHFKGSFSILGI